MKTVRQLIYDAGGECADVLSWADGYGDDAEKAWGECPFGGQMVWFVSRIGADKRRTIRAAAACVESVICHVRGDESEPREALDAVLAYTGSAGEQIFAAMGLGEAAYQAGMRCRDYAFRVADRNDAGCLVADAASVLGLSCGGLVPFQRARFLKQAVDLSVAASVRATHAEGNDEVRAHLYQLCAKRTRLCVPYALVAKALGITEDESCETT
jgi:hypothetical protein